MFAAALPLRFCAGRPGTAIIAMAPIAPAALTLLTAVTLPHRPANSKNAILPVRLLVTGVQASCAVPLSASTAWPVRLKFFGPLTKKPVAGLPVGAARLVTAPPDHRNMFISGD